MSGRPQVVAGTGVRWLFWWRHVDAQGLTPQNVAP